MDTGFLNFNSEEHFSFDYLDQINYENGTDPASATTTWPDDDDDDLPDCGGLLFSNIKDITETLPSDFFNIDVINGESNSLPPLFDTSIRVESSVSPSSSTTSSLSSTTNDDFDLTNYLNKSFEQTTKSSSSIITTKRTIKAPVKKIDKNACKYIIKKEEEEEEETVDDDDDRNSNNDDLVDVCTISSDDDESNHPVLEANDPIDLLEQFELSEKTSHSIVKQLEESLNSDNNTNNNNNKNDDDDDFLDKIPPNPIQIFADDNIETIVDNKTITTDKDDVNRRQINNNNNNNNIVKNQQIRDALPQELIARINESSGKRKPITVIPPIPPNNKKRCNNNNLRTFEAIQRCKINKLINQHNIMNDHDYCKIIATTTTTSSSGSGVYPKEPKKDSGFESAEEDDQQSPQSQQQPTIRNQPIVKNEDGKLMVSLLKVNTINNTNDVCKQKKKLKLEEYKKRRPISASLTTSQNNSPITSGCSSPLPQQPLAPPLAEDENLKRIKHQEKLMRMAAELLNTPPPKVAVDDDKEIKQLKETPKQEEVVQPQPPPDMEMKSFVSVGINTEICSDQQDLLTDIEQYDVIEPLLHKISDKINSNSFITSLIENLPKVKRKKTIQNHNPNNNNNNNNGDDSKQQQIEESVRENLVVVWLPKNRPICKMINQEIQTTITLIGEETQSRYRRRLMSDSESIVSCCSSTSSRSSSSSSISSSSSSSSIKSSTSRRSRKRRRSRSILSQSSQSRSRSRSSRNNHKRNNSSNNNNNNKQISPEQVAEVEERRVIYVGRLEDGLNNDDLLRKFKHFGTITNASVHPRKNGESFGFVTFANKEDAYEAVEHGNDVYGYQRYDLSFGGRRIFCQTSYSDLDDMKEDVYNYQPILKENEESFDSLLRAFLALRKRKP